MPELTEIYHTSAKFGLLTVHGAQVVSQLLNYSDCRERWLRTLVEAQVPTDKPQPELDTEGCC